MDDILVSVICTVYNHEKYLDQCLEGFLSQKTNFKYEVLINDDASTDNSARIIKSYEKKFPNIIKAVCQNSNQCSKGIDATQDILFPLAKGKYIALCEGDDYWCDDFKLQKQVDVMEQAENCFLSVHCVKDVTEDDEELGSFHPKKKLKSGIMSSYDFLSLQIDDYPFQTSSYMFRTSALAQYYQESPQFSKVSPVGDEPLMLYFGQLGNVAYISDVMSAYRNNSCGSWTSKKRNKEELIDIYERRLKTFELFDTYTKGRFHDICKERYGVYLAVKASITKDPLDKRKLLLGGYKTAMSKYNWKEKIMLVIQSFFHR